MSLYPDPNDDRAPQLQVSIVLEADWMKDGLCHSSPWFHDLFFSYEKDEVEEAKGICGECKVRSLCYAYALVYGERGIWGGTEQRERDERRVFVVEDVVELWPRLYGRWQGRSSEQNREQTPVESRESTEVRMSPPVLSEAEAARQRARDRAGEREGDNTRPFDRGGSSRSQQDPPGSGSPLHLVSSEDAATDASGETLP